MREYETLKRRQTYFVKAMRIIARVFIRIEIKNEFPTLPADEPFILMVNHYDNGDIFGVAEALRPTERCLPIRILAHEDFFARWYTRGILEYFGFIPARKHTGKPLGEVLGDAILAFNQGFSLGIPPEGTQTWGGIMKREHFHRGPSYLALVTGAWNVTFAITREGEFALYALPRYMATFGLKSVTGAWVITLAITQENEFAWYALPQYSLAFGKPRRFPVNLNPTEEDIQAVADVLHADIVELQKMLGVKN